MKLLFNLLSACTIATSVFAAVDVSNLANCTAEVRQNTAMPNTYRPLFTANYQNLLNALQAPNVRASFPLVYQQSMLDPFIGFLRGFNQGTFQTIFSTPIEKLNQNQKFLRDMITDASEALLDNSDIQNLKATNAFQEVISDLYDGFLADENRVSRETGRPIKPPDRGILAPLVKWGTPEAGPYTWGAEATSSFQMKAALVSLPPNVRLGGLLAWSALPHETAGHDILHADNGLLQELGNLVYNAIVTNMNNNTFLANYWKQCIDETASDVLGLLNGGPTVGMGLIGYFRSLRGGTLANIGAMPPADAHPIDILRGILAARVVAQMPFTDAMAWANAIRQEVNKDLQTLMLIDPNTQQRIQLITENAVRSAEIVADTIMNTKLSSIEGHSLKEIQNWNEEDQRASEELGNLIVSGADLSANYRNSGYMAAHALAGAIIQAFKTGANIPMIFNRMLTILDVMHQNNATWNGGTPTIPVPPTPTPTPTPSSECDCLCQCFNLCKSKITPIAQGPRLASSNVDLEEMAMGE